MSVNNSQIREAKAGDMADVFELIKEHSDNENISEKLVISVEDLIRDGGFNSTNESDKRFVCLVAENTNNSTINGYAVCYFKIFTERRRAFFVDSLFVRKLNGDISNTDVERQLAEAVLQFAITNNCYRLELHVLTTDALWKIWKQMGAVDLTAERGINIMRINRANLEVLSVQ